MCHLHPPLRLMALVATALLLASCAHNLHVERGLVYAEPEGQPLHMNLFESEEASPAARPAIVLVHGGGWMFGHRGRVSWYARRFAREGYVAMSIDYRKLPRHPFPECVYDAKSAVRWLRANADDLHIDPHRVAAFGSSAGGHIVGMLAATTSDDGFEGTENLGPPSDIDAAIILYGAVDLTMYRAGILGRAGSWFILKLVKPLFSPDEEKEWDEYEWASPITYVHPQMPPVHLNHGTRDSLVPYQQSQRFFDALQQAGVTSELHLHENRNHAFDILFPGEKREMFREMEQWLDDVLAITPELAASP